MSAIPRVLVPITLEDAMLSSSTIAEPDTGETAWVSAGSYTQGDLRIRTQTHRIYRAITTHTGVTTPPEDDATNWQDYRPTNRWAPFDAYTSTLATTTTSLAYVLQPGFINAFGLYGLTGGSLAVTYKDSPGGTVLHTETLSLVGQYLDEWDYAFGSHRQRDRVLVTDLAPYPDAELTLTIEASSGTPVAVGMIALGDARPLILTGGGGTQYGAEAAPKTYSYIKTETDGTFSIRRRHYTTDLSFDVFVPTEDADYALTCVRDVLDVPAAWFAADGEGYDSFNVFGLASARRRAASPSHSIVSIQVRGTI